MGDRPPITPTVKISAPLGACLDPLTINVLSAVTVLSGYMNSVRLVSMPVWPHAPPKSAPRGARRFRALAISEWNLGKNSMETANLCGPARYLPLQQLQLYMYASAQSDSVSSGVALAECLHCSYDRANAS